MTEKLLESTVSLAIREVMGSNFNPESIYLYWNIVSETSDISLTHTVPYSFGTVCFFLLELQCAGSKTYQSIPSSGEVNEWRNTSNVPIHLQDVNKNNFTLPSDFGVKFSHISLNKDGLDILLVQAKNNSVMGNI